MKVAIDISPLKSGHKVRGVGFYLENLKKSLVEYENSIEYVFFDEEKEIPNNIDLVHYPYFDPFFLTLPIFKKYKTIVTVHDLTPLVFPKAFPKGLKGNIKWQMQKIALRTTCAVITDSKASKSDIVKFTGINEEEIHVVYLAAGEEFMKMEDARLPDGQGRWKMEIRKKYNLPEKFVLYVGDVTWNKNLPRLVEALKKTNLPLVMVGKAIASNDFDKNNFWNSDLTKVQNLIKGDERFLRLGFVPTIDLVCLYNLATVFVMPSLYEGFGLPVLEAMSCGCPVVTTKEGSLKEIAGDAAFFVEAYDTESIADGINKVFSDKLIQENLSREGLVWAKNFKWKKTAKNTAAVYKSLTS
ncbi:MAG: glycosyltransferase family 1 protein [Candidatus Levyibacteriota bacterium]